MMAFGIPCFHRRAKRAAPSMKITQKPGEFPANKRQIKYATGFGWMDLKGKLLPNQRKNGCYWATGQFGQGNRVLTCPPPKNNNDNDNMGETGVRGTLTSFPN